MSVRLSDAGVPPEPYVESRHNVDDVGLLQQIGIIPELG
jgi:hypothetical protein